MIAGSFFMKRKKWAVFLAVLIINCAVLVWLLIPKNNLDKDIAEGRVPNFDCIVLEYIPGGNTGSNTVLVQPIESCEYGWHKDLSYFTKPIRIIEDESRYRNALGDVRYHLKNKTLDNNTFSVSYEGIDSFEEIEDEIVLHHIYHFSQGQRIDAYHGENCAVCGKACKAVGN